MSQAFKYAVFAVLAAVIIIGGYFSWQFIFEKNQPVAPPKKYKIGFLLTDKDVQNENMLGFRDGMVKLGYKDGQNIVYVEKNTGGDKALLGPHAKELNEIGLDIIITGATSATKALKDLPDLKTKTFFLSAGQPRNLVANLAAPEGFITGIGEGMTVEFAGKRVEILKEIAPAIKTIISIVEKGHSNEKLFKEKVEAAAQSLGLAVKYLEIIKPDEILAKLPLLDKEKDAGYIGCPCQSNEKYAKQLMEQFKKAKMPSINAEISVGAKLGFLATYSDDRRKTGEKAAAVVERILKGTLVSQVPVEFASDVIFELNLNTAKALGIEVPQAVISRANKIYQE